ncbi:hypothetical protein HAX54_039000, partial [Datura stramonium]|nr:hypothetical protein [Datura stramonium]
PFSSLSGLCLLAVEHPWHTACLITLEELRLVHSIAQEEGPHHAHCFADIVPRRAAGCMGKQAPLVAQ